MGLLDRLKRLLTRKISGTDDNRDIEPITNSYIDSEAISSLTSACAKLENNLGLKSTGRCSICVKDVSIESFEEMKKYIENFLGIAGGTDRKHQEKASSIDISFGTVIDDYGYLWFVLDGRTLEDIIVTLREVGGVIHEKGFSRQLLAAVFEFTDGYGKSNDNFQYLIYNYKLDKFYPFVPRGLERTGMTTEASGTDKKRNNDQELKIMREIENDIPFEKDYSLWYPIWNIPLK
jgi:hypothetical protein